MHIDPVESILSRTIPKETENILKQYADLIDECINIGTNIFEWDNGKNDWVEDLPIIMLLRHFLQLTDSASILIRNSSYESAKLLLRGALESYFYIMFILEDSKKRSQAFIVSNMMDHIKVIERMIENEVGNNTAKEINIGAQKFSLKDILVERKKMLELPELRDAHCEYLSFKRKPKWYQFWKVPNTIKDLSKHLSKEKLYDTLYSGWSENVHGTDVISGKLTRKENNDVVISPIRSWEHSRSITIHTIYMITEVVSEYLKKRLPNKIDSYNEWMKAFNAKLKKLPNL